MTFSVSGGPFGNRTTPTNYTGFGQGYRADEGGWASLTYVQQSGAVGNWKQVRWNSTYDNGPGMLPGGYEEIVWNNFTLSHDVVGSYDYANTSLPVGDYEFTGRVDPSLASEWPWPHVTGAETDPFMIRSMHRMYVEAELIVAGHNPIYYYDATQFTGSSYGAWRALFSAQGLSSAGITYEEAKLGKPYAELWMVALPHYKVRPPSCDRSSESIQHTGSSPCKTVATSMHHRVVKSILLTQAVNCVVRLYQR